jgi:hypothetical protein
VPIARIPSEKLTPVRDRLFSRCRYTGAELARSLGMKEITFWSWLARRGLPVSSVDEVADRLSEWAREMEESAALLRSLKHEAAAPEEGGGQVSGEG